MAIVRRSAKTDGTRPRGIRRAVASIERDLVRDANKLAKYRAAPRRSLRLSGRIEGDCSAASPSSSNLAAAQRLSTHCLCLWLENDECEARRRRAERAEARTALAVAPTKKRRRRRHCELLGALNADENMSPTDDGAAGTA